VDAVLMLEDGRIAEYGSRTELKANPRSRFSTLLRSALELEAAYA
jgi:ABC-type multidrug transport system fused ATPase/permease subunit